MDQYPMTRSDNFLRKGIQNGSWTLEATLLLPLILAVLFFILTVGFYHYDNCLLCAVSGETAVLAAHESRLGYEIDTSTLAAYEQALLGEKTTLLHVSDVSGNGGSTILLTVSADGRSRALDSLPTSDEVSAWRSEYSFRRSAGAPEEGLRLALTLLYWKDRASQ